MEPEGTMGGWGSGSGVNAGTGGWWGTASAGLGALGDIFTTYQNAQARGQQSKVYDILSNPTKLAAYIAKLYQPMGPGQVANINRDLNANWAMQTGGGMGGAFTQHIADAMAKIENQRYQSAAQTAIQGLQGTSGFIPGQQPGGQFGNILKQLMVLRGIKGVGGEQPGISFPTDGGYQDYRAGERTAFPMPGTANEMPPNINMLGGVF
jgi:hypothetical protein